MGLFKDIFGRIRVQRALNEYWESLTGYSPVWTSWGGELYESELIRAAIDAKARAVSKLEVGTQGTAHQKLRTALRDGPNPWQTWPQFLYRLSTILDVKNTAYICPILDEFDEPSGFVPILPLKTEVVKGPDDEPFLRFHFHHDQVAAMELRRVGILTRFQYRDDFFGESNNALDPTMQLITMQRQGITEGIKNSATFRFMARVTNFTKPEDLKNERDRFNKEQFSDGSGGILLFPNTYGDIRQIEQKPYTVDADQMKLIKENVYTYFGVNEDVLMNKAYGDAWSAFYEGAVEWFSIQFSDVMSRICFTARERSGGNKVFATSNRLQYMSNADKLSVSAQMADRGLMTRNEIRAIWNLPPLDGAIGDTLPIRGEYYDANNPPTARAADAEEGIDNEQTQPA